MRSAISRWSDSAGKGAFLVTVIGEDADAVAYDRFVRRGVAARDGDGTPGARAVQADALLLQGMLLMPRGAGLSLAGTRAAPLGVSR